MTDKDKALHVCGLSVAGIIATLIAAALLSGCSTQKKTQQTPLPTVPIETQTNTKIIHTERIDTIYIEIPAQSAERTTPKGFSHLETNYAQSDARINEDGTLTHTLNNKPTKQPVPVKTSNDTIYVDKYIEKPVPVEVPIEVERKMTWWEQTRLDTWGWLATALAVCIGWILRKPIWTLARRFITKI